MCRLSWKENANFSAAHQHTRRIEATRLLYAAAECRSNEQRRDGEARYGRHSRMLVGRIVAEEVRLLR
jgi:hypothetical protein